MAARGKKIRGYPTYNDMVITAIGELKQQTGSSLKDISRYLPEKYNLPLGYEIQVKKALGRQLKKKAVIKIHNRYKVKDQVEHVTTPPKNNVPKMDRPSMKVKPKQPAQVLSKKTASVDVKRFVPGKERTGEIDHDKSVSSSSKVISLDREKKNRKKVTVKKFAAKK